MDRKAFEVDNIYSYDPASGPPTNAMDYLRSVIQERRTLPNVFVSNINPREYDDKRTKICYQSPPKCARPPVDYTPTAEWQDRHLAEFERLREELRQKEESFTSERTLPNANDKQGWERLILGVKNDTANIIKEPEKPVEQTLVALDEVTVQKLISYFTLWVNEENINSHHAEWLYGLFSRLKEPIFDTTSADLRQLLLLCCSRRAKLPNKDDPLLSSMNSLITIMTLYFGQVEDYDDTDNPFAQFVNPQRAKWRSKMWQEETRHPKKQKSGIFLNLQQLSAGMGDEEEEYDDLEEEDEVNDQEEWQEDEPEEGQIEESEGFQYNEEYAQEEGELAPASEEFPSDNHMADYNEPEKVESNTNSSKVSQSKKNNNKKRKRKQQRKNMKKKRKLNNQTPQNNNITTNFNDEPEEGEITEGIAGIPGEWTEVYTETNEGQQEEGEIAAGTAGVPGEWTEVYTMETNQIEGDTTQQQEVTQEQYYQYYGWSYSSETGTDQQQPQQEIHNIDHNQNLPDNQNNQNPVQDGWNDSTSLEQQQQQQPQQESHSTDHNQLENLPNNETGLINPDHEQHEQNKQQLQETPQQES